MNKNIVIIGGGISGLSLLHFLKKKYAMRPDVRIVLLEKNDRPGGNIQTQTADGALFECGPNGFLDSQPVMLAMIEQLGISNELIAASSVAKKRFVVFRDRLEAYPSSPFGIFSFKPFSIFDKMRIFAEPFIPKGSDPNETVHGFFKRRFGLNAAKYFADPMVSGVFGGDSRYLNLQAAFTKIYEYEQTHGSVIRGVIASKSRKSVLRSFSGGMSRLIGKLAETGGESVHLAESVKEVLTAKPYHLVVTDKDKYPADELYVTVPSYAAAKFLTNTPDDFRNALQSIEYAPIAVVGLHFDMSAFTDVPEGFGYLIPSTENNFVLGVLTESRIFEGRAASSHLFLRVMMGGVRHPEVIQWPQDKLIAAAIEEVSRRYGVIQKPLTTFTSVYERAIPQYETAYPALKKRILTGISSLPGLHLVANYLDGVSMNDCVKNALAASERSGL